MGKAFITFNDHLSCMNATKLSNDDMNVKMAEFPLSNLASALNDIHQTNQQTNAKMQQIHQNQQQIIKILKTSGNRISDPQSPKTETHKIDKMLLAQYIEGQERVQECFDMFIEIKNDKTLCTLKPPRSHQDPINTFVLSPIYKAYGHNIDVNRIKLLFYIYLTIITYPQCERMNTILMLRLLERMCYELEGMPLTNGYAALKYLYEFITNKDEEEMFTIYPFWDERIIALYGNLEVMEFCDMQSKTSREAEDRFCELMSYTLNMHKEDQKFKKKKILFIDDKDWLKQHIAVQTPEEQKENSEDEGIWIALNATNPLLQRFLVETIEDAITSKEKYHTRYAYEPVDDDFDYTDY